MESCDNFLPGDAEEGLSSEENAGTNGYWLEVKGRSMSTQLALLRCRSRQGIAFWCSLKAST